MTIDQIIAIAFFIVLVYYLFFNNCDGFADVSFQGYMSSPNMTGPSSFVIFNRPNTIDWNLFALTNRFRFQSILPFPRFSSSPLNSPNTALPTAPQTTPVLMVPGLGDCVMINQAGSQVWPPSSMEQFVETAGNVTVKFDPSNSNLTPLIDTLKALKYTRHTMDVEPYDFRSIGDESVLKELFARIKHSIVKMYEYSKQPVLLVGHDLGCTLLTIFLNRQDSTFNEEYVQGLVCVGSVFGGCIQGLQDYIHGLTPFGKYAPIVRNYDGLQLKLPNKLMFSDVVVAKHNCVDYTGKNMADLLNYLKLKCPRPCIHDLQKESFKKPIVKHICFYNNKGVNRLHEPLYNDWFGKNVSIKMINKESAHLFNDHNCIVGILRNIQY